MRAANKAISSPDVGETFEGDADAWPACRVRTFFGRRRRMHERASPERKGLILVVLLVVPSSYLSSMSRPSVCKSLLRLCTIAFAPPLTALHSVNLYKPTQNAYDPATRHDLPFIVFVLSVCPHSLPPQPSRLAGHQVACVRKPQTSRTFSTDARPLPDPPTLMSRLYQRLLLRHPQRRPNQRENSPAFSRGSAKAVGLRFQVVMTRR